jgi:hypothetical protein
MHFNHFRLSKKQITGVLVFLFTVFGIQSSYADYYPSGIQQNVSEQTLIDNGWTKFYEQTYATIHGGNASLLRPSGQYVILSGKAVDSSTITLAAAAPTAQVFTETVINTPQLLNGTYWYNTPGRSIGFAPTNIIDQNFADISEATGFRTSPTDDTNYESPSTPLRLSWHIVDDFNGGWRLGNLIWLNSSIDYLKQVWSWNGPAAPAPAPAPVFVRQSTNLRLVEAIFPSDTLSDPDGELRKTVDQIMAKYGSLIK